MITDAEFKVWAKRHNYTEDKWGNWTKTRSTGEVIRFKITSVAIRLEKRIELDGPDGKPKNEWMRVRSAYKRDITITPQDQLRGLSLKGCTPALTCPKPQPMVQQLGRGVRLSLVYRCHKCERVPMMNEDVCVCGAELALLSQRIEFNKRWNP